MLLSSLLPRLGLVFVLWILAFPVNAKIFTVVTTFTVIADMARQVAGDLAVVVSVTKPGAEIHGYQPTPRDIVKAQKGDLILWNGLYLELWFQQFFAHLEDVPEVTVSDGITPMSITGGEYRGKPNPHAWMSPDNALIYIDNIRDALVRYDPENAAVYHENAKAYKVELQETFAPLREKIAEIPEAKRWLVTSEGAFSYLARDLAMKELYLWPINADQVGTPQQVRAVIDTVRLHNIPTVFSESTVSPKPMQQVARETGVHYGGVLYVDSLSMPSGPVPSYLDLLKVTTLTIVKAFADSSEQ
ncbi:MAG: metal ABC transporter substrate-binding protein [Alphaproteobacteria bacterium]|nr:metal ABC transporter substrate-binding protein [Alphaproteobacteria bacterium]